jgi:hypothetical protein
MLSYSKDTLLEFVMIRIELTHSEKFYKVGEVKFAYRPPMKNYSHPGRKSITSS